MTSFNILFFFSIYFLPHTLYYHFFTTLLNTFLTIHTGAESNQANVNMRNQISRNQQANADLGSDLPVTYQLDTLQDWSVCKPGHRQVIAL
jgi:hypothetical protein